MTTINLLPWREKARAKQKLFFLASCACAIILALVINGIWYSILQSRINQQSYRNELLQQQVQLAKQATAQQKKFEAEKLATINQLTTLTNLHNQRFRILELLDTLPKLLPNSVYIDEITVDGQTIQLTGKAPTDSQVSELLKRLRAQANWNKIQLQEMATANDSVEKTTFRITLNIN